MNIFKIFGTIALNGKDQFNKDVDEVAGKGSKLASTIGSGLQTAAKVGAAAISVAATGIAALTKSSVASFAEYEQLVGGVETLFKDSANKVRQYADNAYKTAGMSANDYMANATAFSATLISSLGGNTEAAAEYANRAMVSMSDNANKMGTSLNSIVLTYQSLSRGNMAMLDNLKLGYGGTMEELKRLIADAASYTEIQKEMGITVDASSMSFDNIVNAIAVVQGHLGIAGATAKEASTTIEGSVNSMKAAWRNLTVGIADENAELETLIDNFVNSVEIASENLLPRIEQTLLGIGSMVEQLAPIIGAVIPELVATILPPMVQAGISMVGSLLDGIRENLDALATGAAEIVLMLLQALGGMIPDIILMGIEIVVALIEGIASDPDTLVETAINLIVTLCIGLMSALPKIVSAAADLIAGLVSSIILHLPEIFSTGIKIVLSLVGGAGSVLHEVLDFGRKIVQNIIDGIKEKWDGLVSWFRGLWDSLFGNLKVNIRVNREVSEAGSNAFGGSGVNGSHASGLDYVPFNGYIAELHKGEMVVPADEARKLRSGTEGQYIAASGNEDIQELKELFRGFVDALPDMMVDAFSSMKFDVNNREFARLVKAVN